jgi:hypothetical protein
VGGSGVGVLVDALMPRLAFDIEAGAPRWAIERAIHLARDGWRVVHLVAGSAIERAGRWWREHEEKPNAGSTPAILSGVPSRRNSKPDDKDREHG